LGSLLPLSLAVSCGECGLFLQPPSPESLAQSGFILSYVTLPSRVLSSLGLPRIRRLKAPSLGFAAPLRDISHQRVRLEPSHLLKTLPSPTFRTSLTVSSAVGLVGLFHPTATSRVHSSGGCSSSAAASSFDDLVALLSLDRFRYRQSPTYATSSALAFRALLRVRIRNSSTRG